MSNQTFLKLSAGLAVVWVLGLLFVPSFAQLVEGLILLFLSSAAR